MPPEPSLQQLQVRPPRAPWRGTLILAATVFVLSTGTSAWAASAWAGDMRAPRLTLLGAGKRLSVLVTAGDARLLIAAGDDPVAFANALERARRMTTRRLDVALVTGLGRDEPVSSHVQGDDRVRYVASLAPHAGGAAASASLPVLDAPSMIRLGEDVTVTVEVVTTGTDGEDPQLGWRAIIRRGDTTVVVLSDGEDASKFSNLGPISALVLIGGHSEEAVDAVDARAVAVSAETASGRQLRQEVGPTLDHPVWAVLVHPGEGVRLDFLTGGPSLPSESSQLLGTPSVGNQAARAAFARSNSPLTCESSSGSVSTSRPVSAIDFATEMVLA